jgi:hypothetical protein
LKIKKESRPYSRKWTASSGCSFSCRVKYTYNPPDAISQKYWEKFFTLSLNIRKYRLAVNTEIMTKSTVYVKNSLPTES